MNPAMIGHGTSVSNWGTGREQINLGFLQYVLRPIMKRLEQGIWKSLLRPDERRRVFAEFSVEGLLRADSAGRAAFYSQMSQNGLMTRNEIRDLENLPPLPGGDELTIQSNLVPATLLGNSTEPAGDAIDALKRALGIGAKTEGRTHGS
jgi:phage portal protein BeeE